MNIDQQINRAKLRATIKRLATDLIGALVLGSILSAPILAYLAGV